MTIVPPRPRMSSRHYIPGGLIGGKYELVRSLGEGGMGSVWLAKNVALDSVVALKLLRAELDAEDAGERLLQEARAAARLGNRAIVRVFDFGHTDHGDPFIVMELLEGQSLADVLASRSRLSPVKAVQTLLPVADALAVAHEAGIVHRDLKPENIFLAREPRRTQPKIVDFGIAKMDSGGASRSLTQAGTVVGSPGYMSPEQARGLSNIDHRADLWAFCVVLYECITGTLAFEGENYNAIMRAIVEDEVVPTIELAAGDAALWEIIERGLKKNPDERWPSMRALGAALAGWLLSHAVEQDVCGDALSSWLEDADAPRSRDILSVPPPSLLGAPDPTIPPPARTLTETPRPSAPSFRPAPESTAAMVHSGIPARARQGSFLAAAALLFIAGILTATFVAHRAGEPRGDGSAAPGAAASQPAEARPAAVAPVVPVQPATPPVAAAPSAPPAAEPAAAPSAVAATAHKKTAQPATSKPVKRAGDVPAASGGLKDPY